MKARRADSPESSHAKGDRVDNIRTKPPHIYDNITHRLLKLGVTLAITTFVGLIVRYAVQEFDPSVSTITVTTSRVNDRDIASFSVSKHFLERILEFIGESIAIIATIIPLGFPLCTLFNRYFAKIRAGKDKIDIDEDRILAMIPKYVVIGDAQACQMPNSNRLRPLVRDTIFHLIRAHLKPKLIVEDSYEEARKFGIRVGLIRRDHHKLAVIKSVDLLRNITDSRGDIKQGKVRYLLSRMKIMSQSTPADKSFLVYLMKHCESMPNENLAYLGYSFTDPEAMRLADCAVTFADCDDDDVKRAAQVKLKSANMCFTDLYLLAIVCLLASNVTQSYALYQISASVASCIYRFLSITVFQEQLISHSQFTLIMTIQQVFAIMALMTKWLSSLPQTPLASSVAEMSHAATEDSLAASSSNGGSAAATMERRGRHSSMGGDEAISSRSSSSFSRDSDSEAGGSQTPSSEADSEAEAEEEEEGGGDGDELEGDKLKRARRRRRHTSAGSEASGGHRSRPIHLSGVDLDRALIDSALVTKYKQTFHNSALIDDVTYRLVKLQIAYQILVMLIIMIFGSAMFQLSLSSSRQHQSLAFNSVMLNNLMNLANCFNQNGAFNVRSGLQSNPFFVCVLVMAVFIQVCLTELNAFGLENLSPIQWFVCFIFAFLSALIAPLTGQRQRAGPSMGEPGRSRSVDQVALRRRAPSSLGGGRDGRASGQFNGQAYERASRKSGQQQQHHNHQHHHQHQHHHAAHGQPHHHRHHKQQAHLAPQQRHQKRPPGKCSRRLAGAHDDSLE